MNKNCTKWNRKCWTKKSPITQNFRVQILLLYEQKYSSTVYSIGSRKDDVYLQLHGHVSSQPEGVQCPCCHARPKGSSISLCFRFSTWNKNVFEGLQRKINGPCAHFIIFCSPLWSSVAFLLVVLSFHIALFCCHWFKFLWSCFFGLA